GTGKSGEPDAPTFFIIIKDMEQMVCFMLMGWALAIIVFKAVATAQERKTLTRDLLEIPEGQRVLPEDTRSLIHRLQELPGGTQRMSLVRVLRTALIRFSHQADIQDVSAAKTGVLEVESARLDSQLSIIRYIAWAIPSMGFIGTVRGIGEALGHADKAIEGDISLVTDSLGVAFNSTFVALVISIALMFAVHMLELFQEGLIIDVDQYCEEKLVANLHKA
ncbi:MAG: MotA/TolQ/ExbB proton channel family protein, partial [Verrucomicrobiota bacterium]